MSGPICRSDFAPKSETAETIEYFKIRRKEKEDPPGKDVKHPLYSANIRKYELVGNPLYSEKKSEISYLSQSRRLSSSGRCLFRSVRRCLGVGNGRLERCNRASHTVGRPPSEAKWCEPHTRADYWLLTGGRDKTGGVEGPSFASGLQGPWEIR